MLREDSRVVAHANPAIAAIGVVSLLIMFCGRLVGKTADAGVQDAPLPR